MDKEILQATAQFLSRVQLQGNEVPAFTQVLNALNEQINKNDENAKKPTK